MSATSFVLGTRVHKPSAQYNYPKKLIDVPEHRNTIALIRYWQDHEASGGMRMGRHLPSRAIGKFMPNITVCEPIGDWADGRIRLAASILSERFGRDIQGELISKLYEDDRDGGAMLLKNAQRAQNNREPGLLSTRICAGSIEVMRFEVVALPIYAYDGITQWSLVGTFRF